jgi:hypothetical protein
MRPRAAWPQPGVPYSFFDRQATLPQISAEAVIALLDSIGAAKEHYGLPPVP